MEHQATDILADRQDKSLLTIFLQELNITRRMLSLYPSDHPQITTSVARTLTILKELFQSNPVITLGIAPDAIYFEQLWLDKTDPANREVAGYFSALGIASISFQSGLNDAELIRFNQLLRSDRNAIESFGGFDKLLEQQQIIHISVIPIDYDAFQTTQNSSGEQTVPGEHLWEDFLHGLHHGILDFGDSDSAYDLDSVAAIFNQKLVGNQAEREQSSQSIAQFIGHCLQTEDNRQPPHRIDPKLATLLEHLSPEAQQEFIQSTFHALDRHRHAAPDLLQRIPPHLLQNTIAGKNRRDLNLSSRLFGLINNLANTSQPAQHHNINIKTAPLSEEMVRARLDVLFSEERPELYLPDNYQTALHGLLSDDVTGTIPEDEKQKLKEQIETQSIEHNCTAIIFELLNEKIDSEQETTIQQNLLELSRFFLDIGDFSNLRKIYRNWGQYLYRANATISVFDEKLLASHGQISFLTEVLDATELWEEEKHQEIAAYIIEVGEPYSDLVIERLGLAPTWSERKYWMQILEGIGGNAKQMIVAALDDECWYLVRNLLIILGKDIDHQSMKIVQKLTNHPHPKVRTEAIRCLFFCNPATANRKLLQELQSDDPEVLLAALEIADRSQNLEVLELLHRDLNSEPANATELEIKQHIIQTLSRIGNRDSLPILRRILQKQGLRTSKRRKQLQIDTIHHLALFPDPAAEKLLNELTTGKHKQLALMALELRKKHLRGDK